MFRGLGLYTDFESTTLREAGGRSSSRICVRRSATFAELWNKFPGTGQDAHLTTETKEFDEGRTYRPLREQ